GTTPWNVALKPVGTCLRRVSVLSRPHAVPIADGRKRPFRRPDAKLRPFKHPPGASGAPKTARPAPGTTPKPSGKSRILALTALTGAETMEFGPENGGHLPTHTYECVWVTGRPCRLRPKTTIPTSG